MAVVNRCRLANLKRCKLPQDALQPSTSVATNVLQLWRRSETNMILQLKFHQTHKTHIIQWHTTHADCLSQQLPLLLHTLSTTSSTKRPLKVLQLVACYTPYLMMEPPLELSCKLAKLRCAKMGGTRWQCAVCGQEWWLAAALSGIEEISWGRSSEIIRHRVRCSDGRGGSVVAVVWTRSVCQSSGTLLVYTCTMHIHCNTSSHQFICILPCRLLEL